MVAEMNSEARLDSAVFQLTPTRTRFDLVIKAYGEMEKIASGLLHPFLVHLQTAQDQIAKGGYSIILESKPQIGVPWFTKGTVERFVRFVSTPEVLERVCSLESEISQIEEAISIQGDDDNPGLSTVEDHHQTRPTNCIEDSNTALDTRTHKAIVLYKPEFHPNPPDSNGSTTQVKNSKVQLLRVLETRKTMLDKEQGMAFARAAAAGFDMYHMPHLISFAVCFGASRLMKACSCYMELWKKKHEAGKLLEVVAAKDMSSHSELTSLYVSDVVISGDTGKQKGFSDVQPISDMDAGSNGKTSHRNRDHRQPSDPQVPEGPHNRFNVQSQRSTFSQCPPGPPMSQLSRMQGMPYYHGYPGNTPFLQQRKRHSTDSEDSDDELVPLELDVSSSIKQDVAKQNILECEKEDYHSCESGRRHGRIGNEQSSMVVIHNLNYVTSKKHGISGKECGLASNSETKEETKHIHPGVRERKHTKSLESLEKKEQHRKSMETSNLNGKNEMAADSGNWQAFQSFLLRAEEKRITNNGDIFASEKESPVNRNNKNEDGHIRPTDRVSDVREQRMTEFDSVNGNARRVRKADANDELLISSKGRGMRDDELDSQFKGVECRGRGYRRKSDESFMVPFRSSSQNQFGGDGRVTIDMDSEFPSSLKNTKNVSSTARTLFSYEPDDLTLLPERGVEKEYVGYDLARDYDVQVPIDAANLRNRNQTAPSRAKDVSTKSDKGKNLKVPQNGLSKRNKDVVTRKGTSSKLNPLAEAQKRAEQVRAFKAELQKEKKEKEKEDNKRLEGLKRERQKRIAARSAASSQSPSTPKQSRASLPTKLSPSSKFTDSRPVYSSPIQSLPIRTSSLGSINSQKIDKSKVSGSASGLIRSVSSLPELKKVSNGHLREIKATSVRTKRTSDPKGITKHTKSVSDDQVRKKILPDDSRMKISAIIQLDKTKLATLPELKIKTSRVSSAVQKQVTKQTQSGTGCKTSVISESIRARNSNEKLPTSSNINEKPVLDPVIEKNVVMFVTETVAAPMIQACKETIDIKYRSNRDYGRAETGMGSKNDVTRGPIIANEAVYARKSKLDKQHIPSEVVISKNEPRRSPHSNTIEKPFQSLFYGVRSNNTEPATSSLDYSGSPSVLNSEATTVIGGNFRAHVEQSQEMTDKSRSKESRGFRKLLKFGKKNQCSASASGERDVDSDGIVVNGSAASASSNDAHLLKNLISRDNAPIAGTLPKASRPFSLLSTFRSRPSEKKLALE